MAKRKCSCQHGVLFALHANFNHFSLETIQAYVFMNPSGSLTFEEVNLIGVAIVEGASDWIQQARAESGEFVANRVHTCDRLV